MLTDVKQHFKRLDARLGDSKRTDGILMGVGKINL
jgi:hypothetical protein